PTASTPRPPPPRGPGTRPAPAGRWPQQSTTTPSPPGSPARSWSPPPSRCSPWPSTPPRSGSAAPTSPAPRNPNPPRPPSRHNRSDRKGTNDRTDPDDNSRIANEDVAPVQAKVVEALGLSHLEKVA